MGLSAPVCAALAAWPPAFWVLDNGNFEIVILALAVFAWKASDLNHERRAGILLGIAASIKWYPAFFVVPFLLARRWKIVIFSGAVFILAQLISLITLGPIGLWEYYNEILPIGANLWLRIGLNSAPYGMFMRFFGGAEDTAPLVHASFLVLPLTAIISGFAIASLVKIGYRGAPVAVLCALPNVRGYFTALALPQIIGLLREKRFRAGILVSAFAASYVLPLVNMTLGGLEMMAGDNSSVVSVAAPILSSIQTLGLIGLLAISVVMSLKYRPHVK